MGPWRQSARSRGSGGLEATQGNDHYNLWGGAGEFLKKKGLPQAFFPQKTHLFFRPRDPSKKMWQVLGIKLLQFLAQESFSKGEL